MAYLGRRVLPWEISSLDTAPALPRFWGLGPILGLGLSFDKILSLPFTASLHVWWREGFALLFRASGKDRFHQENSSDGNVSFLSLAALNSS